ncbi:MAG: hypothetical protein EZS28_032300, partial [Streblomastix strix]
QRRRQATLLPATKATPSVVELRSVAQVLPAKEKEKEPLKQKKDPIKIRYSLDDSNLSPQFIMQQLKGLGYDDDDADFIYNEPRDLLTFELDKYDYDYSQPSSEARIREFLNQRFIEEPQELVDISILQPLSSEALENIRQRKKKPIQAPVQEIDDQAILIPANFAQPLDDQDEQGGKSMQFETLKEDALKQNRREQYQKYLDEKYKKIREQHNNIEGLQIQAFRLLDEEMREQIEVNEGSDLKQVEPILNVDALLLCKPIDSDKFLIALLQAHTEYQDPTRIEQRRIKDEPTIFYYNNRITSLKDIQNHLNFVFDQEKTNHFKIAIDFGYIVEEAITNNDGSNKTAEYTINYPRQNLNTTSAKNIKKIITSHADMDEFKEYVPRIIINGQEKTQESTHHKFIAIFSMVVVVYRYPLTDKAIPELQKYIKRREVHFIDSQYPNNCVIEALSFLSLPETARARRQIASDFDKSKEKRYKSSDRVADGVKLMIQYYKIPIQSDQGDTITAYDQFYQDQIIEPSEVDENENIDDATLMPTSFAQSDENKSQLQDFNILLLQLKNNSHVLLVSDPEALTGYRNCPFCKQHSVPVKNKNRYALRDFERHVTKCQQNKGKQVILLKSLSPFAPHIFGNKTYQYLIAYERLDEFQPTRYFITYDFETVPRIINQGYGSKSVVNGIDVHNSQQHTVLEPLSVASTIKSKSGIKKIYFDLCQESFIEKWLEQMFKEAKQLKKDNQYEDPEIPYDISIPVLGYNSAHFDIVFVIRYLTNPLWHITSYLVDFSHIKRVEVKHKITGVTLQFLDAMLFITKGTLKQFATDFGNGGKDGQKGVFPYDAINTDNFNDVLSKSEPFSKEYFDNKLRKESITDEAYQIYLEDSKQFKNRWDYLQYYNEQDT